MRTLACAITIALVGCSDPVAADRAPEAIGRTGDSTQVPEPRGGRALIGRRAPDWGSVSWLDGRQRSLSSLRGKVVLVRFWTETCPFCAASAPALREVDRDFRDRGLAVIGMYHPKPRGRRLVPAEVREAVDAFGWTFPIGLDADWAVLDRWWRAEGGYTSVSLLLDREGVVRWVHPGPELHPGGPAAHRRCRSDYSDLRRAIEALL